MAFGTSIRRVRFILKTECYIFCFAFRLIYDIFHGGYCRLIGENYIGRYVHPFRKIDMWAKENIENDYSDCGGFTHGKPAIFIYINPKYSDEPIERFACTIINHEVLHQVLFIRVGWKECARLDRFPYYTYEQRDI